MENISTEALKTLRSRVHTEVVQGTRRTHTFNVDYSDIDPEFVGTFTVKHPSLMDRLQMGVVRTSLTGGAVLSDPFAHGLAHIISTLEVVLIGDVPKWFDPNDENFPYEVLEAVFLEYSEWEATFRKKVRTSQPTEDSGHAGGNVPVLDHGPLESATNGREISEPN